MLHRRTIGAVVGCVAAIAAHAQPPLAPQLGYAESVRWEDFSSPWGFAGFALGLDVDDLFVATHGAVHQIDTAGVATLVQALPIGHDVGLIARPPNQLAVWFSDFQADVLWRYDLTTLTTTSRPMPANAFDLAVEPNGEVLVNANPLWPGPGTATGVWLVDPLGGTAHRELIRLSGPSGPLAFDSSGDLLVAVLPAAVPPAPGSVSLLRYAAQDVQATIAGGPMLHTSDAASTLAQLDGAYDMAFDDRQRLWISDLNNRVIRRTLPGASQLEPAAWSGPGVDQPLGLAFVDVSATTIDGYQPESNEALFVGAVNYGQRSAVHRIQPLRPTLSATPGADVPIGPFTVDIAGMPPSAPLVLLVSLGSPVLEYPLALGIAPVWLGLDPTAPLLSASTTTDVFGDAVFAFTHTAGALTFALQAVGLDSAPPTPALVTSPSFDVQLLP